MRAWLRRPCPRITASGEVSYAADVRRGPAQSRHRVDAEWSQPRAYARLVDGGEPRPEPATVELLLDTMWHVTDVELRRTDALDRKAAAIAGFASLLAAVVAGLGGRAAAAAGDPLLIVVLVPTVGALLLGVTLAIRALLPQEYSSLSAPMLRRLAAADDLALSSIEVGGAVVRHGIEAIAAERRSNAAKSFLVSLALRLLLVGVAGSVLQGSIIVARGITT